MEKTSREKFDALLREAYANMPHTLTPERLREMAAGWTPDEELLAYAEELARRIGDDPADPEVQAMVDGQHKK